MQGGRLTFFFFSLKKEHMFKKDSKRIFSYPQESDNTILFPMLVLVLFTLFIIAIGIPFNQFNQKEMNLNILSKLLIPSLGS